MDVSIIIVAWNVKQLLYDCLKSVYDHTKDIEFEVIYVVNASEDGSAEMVKNEFPEVKIIVNDENKGFIKANNQAIEVADGRYVLLLKNQKLIVERFKYDLSLYKYNPRIEQIVKSRDIGNIDFEWNK